MWKVSHSCDKCGNFATLDYLHTPPSEHDLHFPPLPGWTKLTAISTCGDSQRSMVTRTVRICSNCNLDGLTDILRKPVEPTATNGDI